MSTDPRSDQTRPAEGVFRAPERVGDVLRQARLARREMIANAAAQLHIRAAFLQALEDNRFERLPGPTYVLGFLRSYANWLELDGAALVSRFKAEEQTTRDARALVFPEPLPARSVPMTALVTTGLILAGVVYGAWWYLNNRAAPLPSDLSDVLPPPQALLEPPPAPSIEAIEAHPPEQTLLSAPPGSLSQAAEPALPTQAADPLADKAGRQDPIAGENGENALAGQATPATTLPPHAKKIETSEVGPPPVAAEQTPLATASAPLAAPEAQAQPQTQSQASSKGVLLRATALSWVEISAPGGAGNTILFRGLLKPGQEYPVPEGRNDLILLTGNAGGLEILVDGVPIPPLGPDGAIRRNIALDPEVLRQQQ